MGEETIYYHFEMHLLPATPPAACSSFHFPREYRLSRSSHESLAESFLGLPASCLLVVLLFVWFLACFTVAFRLHLPLSLNRYQSFHTLLSLLCR